MFYQPKVFDSGAGASTTNGATATNVIDCLGADHAIVLIRAGTADVVSNKPTVCKLQEADTTDATNFADIAAFATPSAIPNANTAATATLQNDYLFNVDLRARKRYLRTVYSPQTTQIVQVFALLGRLEQSASTAAKANAMVLVEG